MKTYGHEEGGGKRGWDKQRGQHENIYITICEIDSQWESDV